LYPAAINLPLPVAVRRQAQHAYNHWTDRQPGALIYIKRHLRLVEPPHDPLQSGIDAIQPAMRLGQSEAKQADGRLDVDQPAFDVGDVEGIFRQDRAALPASRRTSPNTM